MWWRFRVRWERFFPYVLIGLVLPEATLESKRSIAILLLDSARCHVDAGFSMLLLNMALQHPVREDQIAFLLSEYVFSIVLAWSIIQMISIYDLECVNAKVRRHVRSGRKPDFCTTAAKGLFEECKVAFTNTWGKPPKDYFQTAVADIQEQLKGADAQRKKPGPAKGQQTGYNAFCTHTMNTMKAIRSFQPGELRATLFGDSDLKRDIAEKWKAMSREQQNYWTAQTAQLPNTAIVPDAAPVVEPALVVPPTSVVGDADSFITYPEYVSQNGEARLGDQAAAWRTAYNVPVGAPSAPADGVLVPADDLQAPEYSTCFGKGDCSGLPQPVLKTGSAVAQRVASQLRAKAKKSKQAKDAAPAAAAENADAPGT
jgi:hypothetical protein